jgi:cephalosporin hydroxylase
LKNDLVRFSRFVCPVLYDEYVELHHINFGTCSRITHDDYKAFTSYAHFRPLQPAHQKWYEAQILVKAECDLPVKEQSKPSTEGALALAYHHWYWQYEIETQRDYRWLGQVAVKMPTDLFFYQELIYSQKQSRILEVGYGRGGSLYFIHTILRLLNRKGTLVGVDFQVTPVEGFDSGSQPWLVHGDAKDTQTLEKAKTICAEYDLVILDLGGRDHLSLELLPMWAQLIAPNGVIVVEDLWSDSDHSSVIQVLDTFLLQNRQFGLHLEANRYPFLKGIALRRIG